VSERINCARVLVCVCVCLCVHRVCVTHRYILKYRTKITEVKGCEGLKECSMGTDVRDGRMAMSSYCGCVGRSWVLSIWDSWLRMKVGGYI